MKLICTLALAIGAIFTVSAAAAQDDVTTSTTTTRTPAHGAFVGVPGVVGVQVGSPPGSGCETRSKTVTDQDTGESHSRTESNC